MLIFRKNIYNRDTGENSDSRNEPHLDPYSFLLHALAEDRNIFIGLEQLDSDEGFERCRILFPHASRFGSIDILNTLSKRLLEALVNQQTWFEMNSYHLCYLYDSLYGTVEEYSYESPAQRMQIFPELQGNKIDLNNFLEEYFTNTAFLIDPDRFNNLAAEEKKKLGLNDPCLFGVINRLLPAKEEVTLKKITQNPYSENELAG